MVFPSKPSSSARMRQPRAPRFLLECPGRRGQSPGLKPSCLRLLKPRGSWTDSPFPPFTCLLGRPPSGPERLWEDAEGPPGTGSWRSAKGHYPDLGTRSQGHVSLTVCRSHFLYCPTVRGVSDVLLHASDGVWGESKRT